MYRHRPKVVERFTPNASAADLGQHVLLGCQFTAVPPPDYPAHDDVAKAILREIRDNFRPLWVNQLWRTPNSGIVKRSLHVTGTYIPITRDRDPRKSGLLVKNLLMPTSSSLGIDWRAPIYIDDIMDGLTDDEKQVAGVLPRYTPLDWDVYAGMKRYLWQKRHAPKPLTPEQEAKAEADKAAAEDKSLERAQVERVKYLKRHDRTNTVNGVKSEVPRTFVSHSLVQPLMQQEGAA